MNFISTATLIASLSGLLLVGTAHADKLGAAMPCELQLEKAASGLVFELSLELNRTNALSSNAFANVRASLDALYQHEKSPAAQKCFRKFPDQKQRYLAWRNNQAGTVIQKAQARLNQVCTRRTNMFIHGLQSRIQAALSKKRLAKAARYASELETGLTKDPMIRRCQATRTKVDELLHSYLPGIQNQAALPKVSEKMSEAYFTSQATISASIDALQTSGRSLKPVALSLESEAGRTALREQIGQCQAYGKAMLELGATGETLLESAQGDHQKLQAATSFCNQVQSQLPELLQTFVAHNTMYHRLVLQRWRRTSVKGWGMEKLYNARGRPLIESPLAGGAITWTYRAGADSKSACQLYRFNQRGKLLGQRDTSCPLVGDARP